MSHIDVAGGGSSPPFAISDTTGLQTALDSKGIIPVPARVAGRWYPMSELTGAAGATGQDTVQLGRFRLDRGYTVSDLGVQVTTTNASNCQAAIYASDPTTGLPTGLPLARTGDISTAVAGGIGGDITGADVVFAAGFYWAAINHQGATAILGASIFPMSSHLQGSTTLTAIVTSAPGGLGYKLTAASAYNTWPNYTGATIGGTFTEVAAGGPFLFLKAA